MSSIEVILEGILVVKCSDSLRMLVKKEHESSLHTDMVNKHGLALNLVQN